MSGQGAEDFERWLDAAFRPAAGPALVLREVARHGTGGFTLIFAGPPGDLLPEGLHDFAVDGGKNFTMHVMPIHTLSRERQDYQAVFN